MKALVFAESDWEEDDLRNRLRKQFDDFDLLLVKIEPSDHTLYYTANNVVKSIKDNPDAPVFVVVTDPMFAAIMAAKLAQMLVTFQVMTWENDRFRVLKVP